MPKYQVIYPVRVPQRGIVREGTVELSERRARRAVSAGSLRPLDGAAAQGSTDETRDARIAAVIAELDPADEAHFTKSGKPDAGVIAERLGETVSAADRDRVWAAMQAGELGG